MELRKCKCGAKPKEYGFWDGFCVQCNECGLATRRFVNHEAAVTAWNIGVDLIRRHPVDGKRIKTGDEIYAK